MSCIVLTGICLYAGNCTRSNCCYLALIPVVIKRLSLGCSTYGASLRIGTSCRSPCCYRERLRILSITAVDTAVIVKVFTLCILTCIINIICVVCGINASLTCGSLCTEYDSIGKKICYAKCRRSSCINYSTVVCVPSNLI